MEHCPRIEILGLKIHNILTSGVLASVERWIDEDRKPRIICTPNVDFLIKARRDKEFQTIVNEADLAVPDGMGVVYASRLLRRPLRGTVSGRLLAVDLCELAAERGWSIFFLGGRPGVAEASARRMKDRYPNLAIAGHACPRVGFSFEDGENQRALNAVREANPDILFVALGAPKQEKWIAKHKDELGVPVSLGVGYAFDVMGGYVKAPPHWVTHVGLEWLYRLGREPRRLWRRYILDNLLFLALLLGEMLSTARPSRRHGR